MIEKGLKTGDRVWLCGRIESEHERGYIKYPLTWWQAIKERFYPQWLLTYFPIQYTRPYRRYHFQGVFDTRDKAVAACVDEHWFIGSLPLNVVLPNDILDWHDGSFPLKKE